MKKSGTAETRIAIYVFVSLQEQRDEDFFFVPPDAGNPAKNQKEDMNDEAN